MKFSRITTAMLVALLTFCAAPHMSAQRKTGAKSRTTTTKSGSTTKSTASKPKRISAIQAKPGGPFTLADYYAPQGNDAYKQYYTFFAEFSPEDDALAMSEYYNVSHDSRLDVGYGSTMKGHWSLSNNRLTIDVGSVDINVTSPDKGNTLYGTLNGHPCVGYKTPPIDGSFDEQNKISNLHAKEAIKANKIKAAYVVLWKKGDPSLAFPVDISFTKTNDGEIKYKLTSNHPFAALLGVTKGTVVFYDDDEESFSFFPSDIEITDDKDDGYSNNLGYKDGIFSVYCGKKNIPGYDSRGIYYYFFY